MKKKIFMSCVALIVSAAAVVGVKAYNYYSIPRLMRINLEALSTGEANLKKVKCYGDNQVDKDETSGATYTICPVGTNEGAIGKCAQERRGKLRFLASPKGDCIK